MLCDEFDVAASITHHNKCRHRGLRESLERRLLALVNQMSWSSLERCPESNNSHHGLMPQAAKDETLANRMPSGCGFLIATRNPQPDGMRFA